MPQTDRGGSWKVEAVVVAAIILVATALLWTRPWEAGAGSGEDVRLYYRMTFTYLGSDDNVPLENLVLNWSAPKVDNSLPELKGGETQWYLYYLEDNGDLTLQATENDVINLRGDRTSQLEMYDLSYEKYANDGPVYTAWFDKLYPREVFIRDGYEIYDEETADKVTLKVYGQTDSTAIWHPYGQENKKIDFVLWAGLYRENVIVEQFEWNQENESYGWYWLWPV